ncbi:MAG: cell division protein FtsA [Rhodospirillales bacterium]|nr:cell division protein FtsA [Rhodospirillales bacterium]
MRNGINHNRPRGGLVAALDIGSTKIGCLIAKPGADATGGKIQKARIVGIGHQVSKGVRSGIVVDMDSVEQAIRSTVEAAEKMAGENIDEVVVNINIGKPKSRLIAYEVSIAGHEIGDADLRRILDPQGLVENEPVGTEVIHNIPVGYSIDGNKGIRDPRGMFGERLGVNMHIISAESGPVRNLETAIARCHLGIESKVLGAYASALACVVEDERQMGVTCVDMGGGTTSIAVFFDGELVHTDSIPVGGQHVSNDIARGLATSLQHAERMKTLYGNAIPSTNDDREVIKVPLVGEENNPEAGQIPRSMLVGIIRPRIEETLEMVRDRLAAAGFNKVAGRRMVLTGGAGQLPGLPELAGTILDKQVRVGKPMTMDGLAEAASGPAFSTCVGLLSHALDRKRNLPNDVFRQESFKAEGRLGRLGHWLKENF